MVKVDKIPLVKASQGLKDLVNSLDNSRVEVEWATFLRSLKRWLGAKANKKASRFKLRGRI